MDMDNERGRNDEDEEAAPSGGGSARARLQLIGHYAMLGFAPVVSVLALIMAVLAYTGNQSTRAQLAGANSRIDNLDAIQSESRGELDIFKIPLVREKAALAEDRKKLAEHEAVIVRNVTQLQIQMKVAPTLEEQLREGAASQVAPAPASAPVAAAPVAASAPAAAPVSKTEKQPIAKQTVPAGKPAPAPTSAEKAAKAQALKKAIEDFNKNSKK
jgi:hypothetical protein